MLALLRRVFGVYGHCLTGTLAAGVILLVTAACGTEAPVESMPAPPAPAEPTESGRAQLVGMAPPPPARRRWPT